jgi:hypothetical protein
MRFIGTLGIEILTKRRHSGFDLFVPQGKRFGYVRLNIAGGHPNHFVVYAGDRRADPRGIFIPQNGNPDDIHTFFKPEDQEKAAYAREVLKSAFDLKQTV